MKRTSIKRPANDIQELRRRLVEAEETLQAIREGAVDALVVNGPRGKQVYTLKDADRPFRALVEEMSEGAATISTTGDLFYCNNRLADMLGLPLNKVLGRPFDSFVAEADRPAFRRLIAGARQGNSKCELSLVDAKHNEVAVLVSLHIQSINGLAMLNMVVTSIRERKAAETQLRDLYHQLVLVQEEERRRLSSELHDDAGQAMTAVKIDLEMLQEEIPAGLESLRQRIRETAHLVGRTMEAIRLLARDLRPVALDAAGLNITLEGYCEDFACRTGIAVRYAGTELGVLPSPVAISLYRLLQEALSNATRHACASLIKVGLTRESGRICLFVEDNGNGFDPEPVLAYPNEKDCTGLASMRERLAFLGGELKVHSQVGRGTRIEAILPTTD